MNLPDVPPGLILIAGAILVPFIKGHWKNFYVIALPVLAFTCIWQLPAGESFRVALFNGFEPIALLRVDKLSKAFGYIFMINAFAAFIYAFHLKDNTQHVAALLYVGSALGVVFAGDLISLYIFWELMAVTSMFLILARKTNESRGAAFRYVMMHMLGGVILMAGILVTYYKSGSISFEAFTERHIGTWLILIGFLVNAAAPPFSAWLSDAYPEATVTGAVILSAYTTKTAVYTLVRGFPGWEILIAVGCVMTIYGIIYALLENDMRRILGYSIINQVGFMVAGVGIGTAIALNGTVAHAFCHIIYKSLLWMSAGAVLHRVGKSKCTELGGLYKTMPWTLILGCVGAIAISAVPLTSGFTSKTLIIQGAADHHLFWAWLVLEIASAGVFLHAGIKFPYFVFFAKDRGLRPPEAPKSMLLGMGIMAFLCIFLGVYPDPLYRILPMNVDYEFHAYTLEHVVTQMQLLMFSALVFFLLLPLLKRTPTISLDTDWFYRKGVAWVFRALDHGLNGINERVKNLVVDQSAASLARFFREKPSWLVVRIQMLFQESRGANPGPDGKLEKKFYQQARLGAYPIGLAILFILVFLGIFYFA